MMNIDERKDVAYIKEIQGGGSTEGYRYISSIYKEKMCIVITDTSNAQIRQAEDRLINDHGIDPNYIAIKYANIYAYDKEVGVLIIDKQVRNIESVISKISGIRGKCFMLWDEPDYDAPGHTKSDKEIKKHEWLNKLRNLAGEVHYISATVAGLAVSEIAFTDIKHIPVDSNYLAYKDLKKKSVGDDDISEMLKTGDMSPTLRNFIIEKKHEGIFIRTERKVGDMSKVKRALESFVTVPVECLNGDNKDLNFKDFKGILISYNMASRGITFPHLSHMICDVPPSSTQPTTLQSTRILGHHKKLLGGNFFVGTQQSLLHYDKAFEIEEKIKKVFVDNYDNPSKRMEEIRAIQLDYKMIILPKTKSNGYETVKNSQAKILEEIEYSKEMEDILINSGKMLVRVVKGNGEWYKGGNRPTDKAIEDIINNAPNSPSGLNKANYQKVSPQYALQRLVSKETIKGRSKQWWPKFNGKTGTPELLVLTDLETDEDEKYNFTDEYNVETNKG
jgi:hypothetical protein